METEKDASNPEELLGYLQAAGLFRGISPEALQTVSEELRRVVLPEGERLFSQGEASDAMYVIIRGHLKVSVCLTDAGTRVIGELKTGEPVGELQLLTGGSRTATAQAVIDTELVKLPKAAFERAARKDRHVMVQMAELIHRRLQHYRLKEILPRLFGPLDVEMIRGIKEKIHWLHLRRGQYLFRQGDRDCSLYVLMSGRLQAAVENEDGNVERVGEVSPGESVGEMALFTGEDRSASIY